MSNKQIQLTRDQLRAIARYELTFRDIIGPDDDIDDIEFVYPEPYTYTMEDLRCAIAAIIAADARPVPLDPTAVLPPAPCPPPLSAPGASFPPADLGLLHRWLCIRGGVRCCALRAGEG